MPLRPDKKQRPIERGMSRLPQLSQDDVWWAREGRATRAWSATLRGWAREGKRQRASGAPALLPSEQFGPPPIPIPKAKPGPFWLPRLMMAPAVLVFLAVTLLGSGWAVLAFTFVPNASMPDTNSDVASVPTSGMVPIIDPTQTLAPQPSATDTPQPPSPTATQPPPSPTASPTTAPTSTLPPAPTSAPTTPADPAPGIQYFVSKYGFDQPGTVQPLPQDEWQRLKQMVPYAVAATARYNARFQQHVEPEMLLWWTHAEGIGARINYSNCANESPPNGQSYFRAIMNCDRPDFWQLGYGNQFGNIWVLKTAFADLYGNPNDAALVRQVGQAVLNYDLSQQTTPRCGGYSCTFPALTIDQIMADVHYQSGDHRETAANWWASVLSRDPRINSYMLALALSSFSHAQTRNWVGCYYQEPCWQYESDCLWQILANWQSLSQ